MCQSKLNRPTANVINEIEVGQEKINLNKIEICLLIITILIGLNFVLKIYNMHTRRLRKIYLSRANDVDKV